MLVLHKKSVCQKEDWVGRAGKCGTQRKIHILHTYLIFTSQSSVTFRDPFYRVCVLLGFDVTCQKSELLYPSRVALKISIFHMLGSALIWEHWVLLDHVRRRVL